MAILCSHCGATLPKEDSHYCNNCGTLVASHPFSPQSLAARKNSASTPPPALSAPVEVEKPVKPVEKPAIREQIAQQPPARPVPQPTGDASPEKIAKAEKGQQEMPDAAARATGAHHRGNALSTMHELRVKIWEQKETIAMIAIPETPALAKEPAPTDVEAIEKLPTTQLPTPFSEQSTMAQEENEDEAIEDRPTQLMQVPPPTATKAITPYKESTPRPSKAKLEQPTLRQVTPLPPTSLEAAPPVMPDQILQDSYLDRLERMETLHLPAAQTPVRSTPPSEVQPLLPPLPLSLLPPPTQSPILPRSLAEQNGPAFPLPSRRPQRHLPFVVVTILLLVLISIGGGTWIYLYQPFNIAPVTRPQQSFTDAALGISLLYPTGWTTKADRGKSILYLADTSNTAQVQITVTKVGGDPNQYMQQQVAQLAMTGAKPGAPVTFAGNSWQQMQGTLQQSGANYTATLFATMHGNHIVTLLQLAQQTVYPDEETTVFAPLRASLMLA